MSLGGNAYATFPGSDYIDLVPYQYGREFCKPGHTFGPAQRNHYLFHYIVSGKGTLVAENERKSPVTHELHGGQGFMIFPRQVCTYAADMKEPWVYTWVEFDGLRVRETLSMAGLTPSTPVYNATSNNLRAQMEQELLFLSAHIDAPALQLIGHLYLFLDLLVRSCPGQTSESSGKFTDGYAREAIDFITQHYQDDIGVTDIAKSTGLNRSYFGKVFKAATGKTPQQYLIDYRMTKAAELLKLTALSVGEVGAAVGYPNQLHFSRAFKTVNGLSPREWRKENSRSPQA
ncbi:MAG: AraC family transcriptional regulator [Eggerthellaceae bacterium]|nr:AraC family transcriptional regulator [Eggerthellaceae bacterium]